MAKDKGLPKPSGSKRAQILQAYKLTAKHDKKLNLILLAAFGIDFVVVFVLGLVIHHVILGTIFAVLTGILSAMVAFGNRVQKSAYAQVEGQVGAAAAVLDTMKRGGWTITPMVAISKQQDVVHRAVGRPGIVLVGEGPTVGPLLDAERKRMNRFVTDIPVTEIVVGDGEGEVPLPKLTKFVMGLPKTLIGGQVTEVNDRLRAVGDVMKNAPMPKGPMPKGAKMPKGPRR